MGMCICGNLLCIRIFRTEHICGMRCTGDSSYGYTSDSMLNEKNVQ